MPPSTARWRTLAVLASCTLAAGGTAWAAPCANGINTLSCEVPAGASTA